MGVKAEFVLAFHHGSPCRTCMRLGVTGRSRTDINGPTIHGSAIELRPHPSARKKKDGLGGRDRTCDLVLPRHARSRLRYTEMSGTRGWFRSSDLSLIKRVLSLLSYARSVLAPRDPIERPTTALTGRRSTSELPGNGWWVRMDSNHRVLSGSCFTGSRNRPLCHTPLLHWRLVHDSNVQPPAS